MSKTSHKKLFPKGSDPARSGLQLYMTYISGELKKNKCIYSISRFTHMAAGLIFCGMHHPAMNHHELHFRDHFLVDILLKNLKKKIDFMHN